MPSYSPRQVPSEWLCTRRRWKGAHTSCTCSRWQQHRTLNRWPKSRKNQETSLMLRKPAPWTAFFQGAQRAVRNPPIYWHMDWGRLLVIAFTFKDRYNLIKRFETNPRHGNSSHCTVLGSRAGCCRIAFWGLGRALWALGTQKVNHHCPRPTPCRALKVTTNILYCIWKQTGYNAVHTIKVLHVQA